MLAGLKTKLNPQKPEAAKGARHRKAVGLIYGRDDLPPFSNLAMLGLQHAIESASKITLPVAVLLALGSDTASMQTMISATLIASGICTIVVSSRHRIFGFGHLTPSAIISSFVAPAMIAVQAGGLRLLAGMTFVTGLVVVLLSRILHRWRALFPPEVVGLIAFMVGASQVGLALSRFLGVSRNADKLDPHYLLVASVTLALLAGLTVWGKGRLRLLSSLITLIAGYGLANYYGFIRPEQWKQVTEARIVDLPTIHPPGLAFNAGLLIPFIILGLSAAMKNAGDLAVSEKISDPNWKRADLRRSRSGMLSFGLGTMVSSLFGGFAVMSSSSNIGLAAATGAASRYVGYACGSILIALAFLPRVVALLTIVPPPVAGAMFLLVVSYNLIAGMQIIMSRMMETRHTYIVGFSLLFGLGAENLPDLASQVPDFARPLLSSGLTVATVMVVFLNALFHVGTSRRQSIRLMPEPDSLPALTEFIEEFTAQWGARREVAVRAVGAMIEFLESVIANELVAVGDVEVSAFFDEYRLDFAIRYRGKVFDIPKVRPQLTLDSDPADILRLSGYMLSRLADSVKTQESLGVAQIDIHFEH
ncbi:MAG: solute carrier family 23 protein [Bryobacteraceae bacterium]